MLTIVRHSATRAFLASVALAACAAQPAFATSSTANANLGVSATVTSNCDVTTTPVTFGSVDVTQGNAVDGTGGLSVTCTNGTLWTAAADAGGGSGADLNTRKMTSGLNTLNYALFVDNGHSSVWGDGVDTATIGDTGTGSAQSKTIYGQVLGSQQGANAGSYSDTVTVTVSY